MRAIFLNMFKLAGLVIPVLRLFIIVFLFNNSRYASFVLYYTPEWLLQYLFIFLTFLKSNRNYLHRSNIDITSRCVCHAVVKFLNDSQHGNIDVHSIFSYS